MVEPIRETLTAVMVRNNKPSKAASHYSQEHGISNASHTQPTITHATHQTSDNSVDKANHRTVRPDTQSASENHLISQNHHHDPSLHRKHIQADKAEIDSNHTRTEAVNGSLASPTYGQLVLANMLAGSIAGAAAAAVTTPFDVVKTNMQLAHTNDKSMMTVLQSVYQQQGMKGLLVGVGPRAVRCAPACAIVISCYEVLKAMLGASA
jgi:hypothetical protein